jgi:hypothetical protein
MMRLADQAKLARAEIVSEIRRNQIVRSRVVKKFDR